MKPNPASPPLDDEALERMLDAHHQRTPVSLVAGTILAGAVFWLLSQRGVPAHLPTWFAAVLSTLFVRAVCARIYKMGGKRVHSLQRWLTITRATVVIGGMAWAVWPGSTWPRPTRACASWSRWS